MGKVRTSTLINRIEDATDKYRFDEACDVIYARERDEDTAYYYHCQLTRQNIIYIANLEDRVSECEIARYEYEYLCKRSSYNEEIEAENQRLITQEFDEGNKYLDDLY